MTRSEAARSIEWEISIYSIGITVIASGPSHGRSVWMRRFFHDHEVDAPPADAWDILKAMQDALIDRMLAHG